jgi:hypothetical protein
MATARRWLRAVLYRSGMQFGWLWLAAVAWFAVWFVPDGRWNRTFDGRAIAKIISIESDGAENADLWIVYVFRANGREYTNHGIDANAPPDLVVGREVEVAYVSSDPAFSELRTPGVRTRYSPVSTELAILGGFSLVGLIAIGVDLFRGIRDLRRDGPPPEVMSDVIQERKPPVLWFLFVLPAVALAAIATLIVLYQLPS